MTTYPTINEIEIAWRKSGTGVCIIVEGETELEDTWFYKQWFDYRAREVSFFPQNGSEKVGTAVAELRKSLGPKQVYGILDRDFASAEDIAYPPIPANGIVRTQKYTLENYLLDPSCWFKYIQPHLRRSPKPGWTTLDEAKATIAELYRECFSITAYNWTLWRARNRDYQAFMSLPGSDKRFKEHPKALENVDVLTHLESIQTTMGLTDPDLPQQYTAHLTILENATVDNLDTMISGKYVLKLLRENFPLGSFAKQHFDSVLDAYMDTCSDPPLDLVELIGLILRDAHA